MTGVSVRTSRSVGKTNTFIDLNDLQTLAIIVTKMTRYETTTTVILACLKITLITMESKLRALD